MGVPFHTPVAIVPKVVRFPDPAQVESAVSSTLPSPTWLFVKPVKADPSTAGRVVEIDGTPAPDVTNTPEFAVAIDERTLAEVV